VDPNAPSPTLARLALANFLDLALGARLRQIERDRAARLEAFHDYLLLIRHVRSLQDSDTRLQALAMTAFDTRTGTLRLHSDRPLALAAGYQAHGAASQPDSFVAELVSLLVSDDLDGPVADAPR
jgi:hypothetical protein